MAGLFNSGNSDVNIFYILDWSAFSKKLFQTLAEKGKACMTASILAAKWTKTWHSYTDWISLALSCIQQPPVHCLLVMVNLMSQPVYAIRCPDIWPNIMLDVSMRVFLDEGDIWTSRLSEADLLSFMWVSFMQSVEDQIEQKVWVKGVGEGRECLFLPD